MIFRRPSILQQGYTAILTIKQRPNCPTISFNGIITKGQLKSSSLTHLLKGLEVLKEEPRCREKRQTYNGFLGTPEVNTVEQRSWVKMAHMRWANRCPFKLMSDVRDYKIKLCPSIRE